MIARPTTLPATTRQLGPIEFLFLLFALFPYISIVPIPTDTQPYALVFAVLLLLSEPDVRLPKPLWLMLAPIIVSAALFVGSRDLFTAFRSLVGYISFFAISAATILLIRRGALPVLAFTVAIWVYAGVGFIQNLGLSGFATGIVADSRTSAVRGVTSLAPEPSYFAIVMAILLAVVLLFDARRRAPTVLVAVVAVVFLARSALGAMFLVAFLIVYFWFHFRRLRLFVFVGAVVGLALFLAVGDTLPGRLPAVARLLRDPVGYLARDGSVNDRFFHIVFSFQGAFERFLIPAGTDAWPAHVIENLRTNPLAFQVSYTRIMSAYGGTLFELGLVGAILPIVVNGSLLPVRRSLGRHFWTVVVFLNVLLLTAVPLAFPPLALLFGVAVAGADRERQPVATRSSFLNPAGAWT